MNIVEEWFTCIRWGRKCHSVLRTANTMDDAKIFVFAGRWEKVCVKMIKHRN